MRRAKTAPHIYFPALWLVKITGESPQSKTRYDDPGIAQVESETSDVVSRGVFKPSQGHTRRSLIWTAEPQTSPEKQTGPVIIQWIAELFSYFLLVAASQPLAQVRLIIMEVCEALALAYLRYADDPVFLGQFDDLTMLLDVLLDTVYQLAREMDFE